VRKFLAGFLFLSSIALCSASLLLQHVGAAKAGCAQVVHTYTTGSAATETVPTCSPTWTNVVIEGYGPGGNGISISNATCKEASGGGGSYVKKTITMVAADNGKTMTYTVGTAVGTSTTTTTSNLANGSASAPTAGSGTSATGGSTQGAGGTASNGDTNTSGSAGTDVRTGSGGGAAAGPLGGAAQGTAGAAGNLIGGGGAGWDSNVGCDGAGSAGNGASGELIYTYNP
jgi:hypothetical protein